MVSLIIPSYKNAAVLEKQLPPLIQYIISKGIEYEIIIVDDGSNDRGATHRVAQKHNCILIAHTRNLGKGAAVRSGMLKATGDYRIFTDADIPFNYSDLESFINYLKLKEFDVVVGDRTLKGSLYFNEIKGFRKLASKFFTFFVTRFITTGLLDTQCGLKGFSAKAAISIFSRTKINSFAMDVELLYIAIKKNYGIKRLPVILRNQEASSVNLLMHAPKMLFDLLRIKIYHILGAYK